MVESGCRPVHPVPGGWEFAVPQEFYVFLDQAGSESSATEGAGDSASQHTAKKCLLCGAVILDDEDYAPVYTDWLVGHVHDTCYDLVIESLPKLAS